MYQNIKDLQGTVGSAGLSVWTADYDPTSEECIFTSMIEAYMVVSHSFPV